MSPTITPANSIAACRAPACATPLTRVPTIASRDKRKSTVGELTTTLGSITDGATAEKAKGALESLVGGLKGQLGELANLGKLTDNVAGMKDGLLKPVMEKVTGLLGNPDIAKAIAPVLNQLKGLVSGS